MPTISSFQGIQIKMYWMDHNPPHVHIVYGDASLLVSIYNPQIDAADLPKHVRKILLDWIPMHRDELIKNWELAKNGEPLEPVKGWEE